MNIAEDRIVAFIDILGFKSIIKQSDQDDDYSKIYTLLTEAIEIFDDYNEGLDLHFTHFSDSFVISSKRFGINDTMAFMINIQDLIYHFLSYNILLRGGITIGKLIHTDSILLGPGLIRAYELESMYAIYPRVIIDQQLTELWESQLEDYNFEAVLEISKDSDEYYFMDYINGNLGKTNLHYNALITAAKRLIQAEDLRLIEKGTWLKDKINF